MADLELILPPISLILLIAYHIGYWIVYNRDEYLPFFGACCLGSSLSFRLSSLILPLNLFRRKWAKRILMKQDGILAIQTIRNTQASSSLLATASILISVAVYNSATQRDLSPLLFTKTIILAILFLLAFFSFTMVLRDLSHAGYLLITLDPPPPPAAPLSASSSASRASSASPPSSSIVVNVSLDPVPPSPQLSSTTSASNSSPRLSTSLASSSSELEAGEGRSPKKELKAIMAENAAARLMTNSAVFSWFGLRCYYLSVPAGMWVLGPVWLFVSVLFSLCFLYFSDTSATVSKHMPYSSLRSRAKAV